jgi:hypothetical protein
MRSNGTIWLRTPEMQRMAHLIARRMKLIAGRYGLRKERETDAMRVATCPPSPASSVDTADNQ